jgi:hypothetical protein
MMHVLATIVADGRRRWNVPAVLMTSCRSLVCQGIRWQHLRPQRRCNHRNQQKPRQRLGEPPHKLRASNLQTKFFGKPFANLRRQPIVHMARPNSGYIYHRHGCRRGHGHNQPN